MGAEYADIDVISQMVRSPDDFESRANDWWKKVEQTGSQSRSLVVHFARVKEEFKKAGVDFTRVIVAPCHQ